MVSVHIHYFNYILIMKFTAAVIVCIDLLFYGRFVIFIPHRLKCSLLLDWWWYFYVERCYTHVQYA